jgi:hypothetical protein
MNLERVIGFRFNSPKPSADETATGKHLLHPAPIDSATGAVADLGTTGTPALTLTWACGYKIPSSPTKVEAKYLPATCR